MPRRLHVAVLMVAILGQCSLAIHSHEAARAPSPCPSPGGEAPGWDVPEPAVGAMRKARKRGSFPARCNAKCDRCEPCEPVEVSIRTEDDLKENEYYPQVWRCTCGNIIFSP